MAVGAFTGMPIHGYPALRAPAFCLLLCNPGLDPLLSHVLQILDHMLMVGDPIDNMNISKIPQPLTWKVAALKTPGYLFLRSALAEPVFAYLTGGEYRVRQAAITTNLVRGDPRFTVNLLHLFSVVQSMCQVSRARAAVNPADPNAFAYILLHCPFSLSVADNPRQALKLCPPSSLDCPYLLSSNHLRSAKTTEVSTCRSGMDQYLFSNRSFSSADTNRKPRFS